MELFLEEYRCPCRGPLRHQLRSLRHALCNQRLGNEQGELSLPEKQLAALAASVRSRESNREAWKTRISLRELDPFLTLNDFSGDSNPGEFLIL